jgi:hypothetical protein
VEMVVRFTITSCGFRLGNEVIPIMQYFICQTAKTAGLLVTYDDKI